MGEESQSQSEPNDCVSGDQNEDLKNELVEMLKGVVTPKMCDVDEQCIYKVPPRIRSAHPQAYTPQVISIGPYHNPRGRNTNRDTNILWSMEDFKLKYLRGFLDRTKLSVVDLVSKLQELEKRIRSCYAGHVMYNHNDFLKIIVTDACFIIELFLRHLRSRSENWNKNDPILSKRKLFYDIRDDLLLLENQLAFFVLEEIFNFAGLDTEFGSFITVTLNYFRELFSDEFDTINISVSPKHFIDLVRRIFFFPLPSFDLGQTEQEERFSKKIDRLYSVSQLSEVGLLFMVSTDSDGFFDLKFDYNKGVLEMPRIHVHDSTETHIGNILAFEECHFPGSAYIAEYLRILGFLIKSEKDVNILVDKQIIVNWMGDANSVATTINNLNKNVTTPDLNKSYYSSLCRRVNAFYENPWNKYKAIFKHEYSSTPWRIASTIAAILLLLLTLIQTICSVWSLAK